MEELTSLGMKLAEVVSRNTVSYVGGKIGQAKLKNDLTSQGQAYNEIIDSLLEDKQELTLIARGYKEAYEQINISDEDIAYLHETLTKAATLIAVFSSDSERSAQSIKILIELLNKDTLKTMQLLGFNYKEAIGLPLTEACANAIKKKIDSKVNGAKKK